MAERLSLGEVYLRYGYKHVFRMGETLMAFYSQNTIVTMSRVNNLWEPKAVMTTDSIIEWASQYGHTELAKWARSGRKNENW